MKLVNSKIYYLAHPLADGGNYTKKAIAKNYKSENRIANDLLKSNEGLRLLRPLTLVPPEMSEWDAMERCYRLLSVCDTLLLPPGWKNSTGCVLEYKYAVKNQLDIIEIQNN